MKTKYISSLIFATILTILSSLTVVAQVPSSYLCSVRNDSLLTSKIYEFDIYLQNTDPVNIFELATFQAGIVVNTSIVNGGTITASIVSGSSQLVAIQRPTSVTFTAPNCIKLAPKSGPGMGSGTIVPTSLPGVRVARIRLTNNVDFGQATPDFVFNFAATPYNTIVSVYDQTTTLNVNITNSIYHSVSAMFNPLLNGTLSVFNVTGGGISPSPVGLNGSQTGGVNYILYKNSNPSGWAVDGTGLALSFGNQTDGTYTVKGHRKATYMTSGMTGSVVVTSAAPVAYAVTGGGAYCQGTGGLPVGVANSETGVTYTLYIVGVSTGQTTPGTGSAVSFGNQLAGSYTVKGTNAGGTTDMTGTAVITENPLPAAPTAVNVTNCFDGTTYTGSATVGGSETVVWYTAPTGGSVTVAPSRSAVGSTTAYAASRITATGCESATRTAVTVTINALPAVPTAVNVTNCFDGTTYTGSATVGGGETVVWYTAPTGGSVTVAPSRSAVGTTTAYAAAKITATGCESATRTAVTVTINALPSAPAAVNVTNCFDGTTYTGSATVGGGETVVWYTAPTGGSVTVAPSRSAVGTTTAYAAAKITATGCESGTRTAVTVTINALPSAPTAVNVTNCFDGITYTGSATVGGGETVVWYTAPTGGSVTVAPSRSAVGSTTAYAASRITATGCESATRTAVTVTINALPAVPTAVNVTNCFDGTTYTGSATVGGGETVVWYTAPTGGSVTVAPSRSAVGSTTAYAASRITATGCESATRTAVTVTINALPSAPAAVNVTNCFDGTTYTGSATVGGGETVVWYTAPTGGSVTVAPSRSAVGSTTAYAASRITATGCESATRTAVTVTINALPSAPTAVNVTNCFDGTTYTGSATVGGGETVVWYTAPTGGSVTVAPARSTVGTSTAYAAARVSATGCESTTRTQVSVTINPLPSAPTAVNVTTCYDGTTYTGSATVGAGETVVWYTLATGGTTTVAPSRSTAGTTTAWAAARITATGCESATRTAVTVTINALPSAPTAVNVTKCFDGTTYTGSATAGAGETVVWYTASSGGTTTTAPSGSAVGVYTAWAAARVTATGCESSTRTQVTVTINALPSAPAAVNVTHCYDGTIYTASATAGAGETVVWYTLATGGTVTVAPSRSAVGTTTAYAAAKITATGCESATRTQVTVTINETPAVTFTGTLTAQCVSSTTYALSGGLPVGGTYSGNGVSGTNFNASVAGVGTHTITYSYTNGYGCTATATNTITVYALPVPTLTIFNGTNVICYGTPVTFIAGGGDSYNFKVGGITVQNGASNTYVTSTLTNGQKVSVTVTNSNGCSATSSDIQMFVNPLPFMAITTAPTCALDKLTYYLGVTVSSGTVTSTAGNVTYMGSDVWSITNIPANTDITVRVVDVNTCEKTIPVKAPDCSCPIVQAPGSGGDKSYCETGVIPTLTATAQADETVEWYNAPIGGTLLQTGNSYTPLSAGTYYAMAKKTAAPTCVSSTRTPISVIMNPLPIPSLTSSDTDNKFCAGTSITFTAQGGINFNFRINSGTVQIGTSNIYTTAGLTNGQIVDVVVTNSFGCSSTSSGITNTVYALPAVTFGGTLAAQCVNATSYTLTGGLPVGGFYSGPGVSGTNFNASVAGVGTHTITYSYTNINGCTSSATNIITVNALPTVTFTGTLAAQCVNSTTYTLSGGTPAGGTYSGPGVSGTNFNASVAGVGTYTITYSYTNGNGCTNTATNTITVNALPTVTFTGTLAAQCINSTTYALSGGTPVGGTYSGPGVSGTNFNASAAGLGTHTITYTYTNVNGCTSSATKTITVNALPTVTFSGTLTAQCASSTTYTLTGGSPAGGTYSGPGVSGTNFNASVAGVGTHTITYSYTNVNGCTNSATKTITVNALPTVTFTGTLTAQCLNSTTYILSGGSPSGGTYSGPGVTGNNFNASVAGVGTHTITYSYTNANGCTNSATNTVTVNALPVPTLTSSDADNTFCAGTSVTFTAGGGSNYNFRIGGLSVQNSTSNTYTSTTISNNQVVNVVVTNTNGCSATSTSITNTVIQVPAGNAGTGGNECDLDFVLNAVPSIGTGTWTFTTTSPGSATFNPNANTATATVSVTEPGTYYFTWTEINNICSKSSTITVNFYKQPVADAGKGGNNCGPSRTLGAIPSVGTGTWTKTSGPGTVTFSPNANNPKAIATVSAYGLYNFTWTEVNGTCSSSDTINVNFLKVPSANAGADASECDLDHVMAAVQGTGAGAGSWSLISGPGSAVFTPSASQPGATVTVDKYGTYNFAWTEINGTCFASDQVTVIFRPLPAVNAGRDTVKCLGNNLKLQALGTGTFNWKPAVLVSNPNISNPDAINIDPVNYVVTLTDQYGCKNSDTVFVDVWDTPFAFAGADTTLNYIFTLKLDADELNSNETGTWSTITGSAKFDNPQDPKTQMTDLSVGENIILWTVTNGICPDFKDYVTINVNNLVVPSLITPNGDQNNEYFKLQGIETLGKTELIIFDRRGVQVWKSDNYENDWNGLDHNGKPLPEDTYYFTLRAQNGVSMSGYVVIRR